MHTFSAARMKFDEAQSAIGVLLRAGCRRAFAAGQFPTTRFNRGKHNEAFLEVPASRRRNGNSSLDWTKCSISMRNRSV